MIPGFASLALVGKSASMIPRKLGQKGEPMIKGFTSLIVGTSMLKPISSNVAGL